MDAAHATVEIKGSPMKLIGLCLAGILMTAVSGAIAVGVPPIREVSFFCTVCRLDRAGVLRGLHAVDLLSLIHI